MDSPSAPKYLKHATSTFKPLKVNLCGTLLSVGILHRGKTGNSFFNIYLQISKTEFEVIKVMVTDAIREQFLNFKMENIQLLNLTRKEDTIFFNQRFSSRCEQLRHDVDFEAA